MTDFEDVGECIEKWRTALGLNHWEVILDKDPITTSEDSLAGMYLVPFRKVVHIKIAGYFFDTDEDEQELALLHELLHVHTRPMFDVVCDQIESLSTELQRAIKRAVLREMEICTADVSEVIYSLQQEIDELKAKKHKGDSQKCLKANAKHSTKK